MDVHFVAIINTRGMGKVRWVDAHIKGVEASSSFVKGWRVYNKGQVRRLVQAIEDGAILTFEGLETDEFGKTRARVSCVDLGDNISARLKELGY